VQGETSLVVNYGDEDCKGNGQALEYVAEGMREVGQDFGDFGACAGCDDWCDNGQKLDGGYVLEAHHKTSPLRQTIRKLLDTLTRTP